MARFNEIWQETAVFTALICYCQVVCNENLRVQYIKSLESCKLAEFSKQLSKESEMECRLACLGRQDTGNDACAAYQWDAASGSCYVQDALNVTGSAVPGSNVGLMLDEDLAVVTCADENACPAGFLCKDAVCKAQRRTCFMGEDCAGILAAFPTSQSGVYYILPRGTQEMKAVWCDMDTDSGGWTVFLKRQDGSTNFDVSFAAYRQGFGNVSGEYWLGLDVLHTMTSTRTYQLRADVSDWEGDSMYSLHESVVIADITANYRLSLGAFLSGDSDSFAYNNNLMFTAKDADHDRASFNCAVGIGGFWYRECSPVLPTGKYYHGGSYTNIRYNGMLWRTWSKHFRERWYSQKTVQLKLRP